MKKMLNKIFIALLAVAAFSACKKEGVLTYLDVVTFPPGFTASTSSVVLQPANDNSSVITFSWQQVVFKIDAPVTYKLQLDVPSDTIGTGGWANAYTVEVGSNVLSKSFLGIDLNTIALTKLGMMQDSANTMVARAVAVLDRSVYSDAATVMVNPYKSVVLKKLWVPGDYQGWNPGGAPTLSEAAGHPNMYEGYVYIPTGGSYQFKMTPQADWTPTAYGDATGNSGDIIEANYAGGNMMVSDGGYYELTADLNAMKWTATKTTWSIIGDATPGGWGSDTQMTYDATNQVWKVTADMSAAGSFKFRANNDWKIDFGVDGSNNLVYADSPFFGYTGGLNNLSVPSSGNYTITLDLHDSQHYTYDLHKN